MSLLIAMLTIGCAQDDGFEGALGEAAAKSVDGPLVVAVGDSQGWSGSPTWPSQLAEANPDIEVWNLSVGGSTAAQWAAGAYTLDDAIAVHPDVLTIQLGMNDMLVALNDRRFTLSEAWALKASLESIIDQVHAGSPETEVIVLSGIEVFDGYSWLLPSIMGSGTVVFAGLTTDYLAPVSVATLTQVAAQKAAATSRGATFLDIRADFIGYGFLYWAAGRTTFFSFGAGDPHPNTAGAQVMYLAVEGAIDDILAGG